MPDITTSNSNTPTQEQVLKKSNINLKKITLPLVLIIIALSILTFILNTQTKKPQSPPDSSKASIPTSIISPEAQSVLTLLPNPLTLDANGNGIINVNLETNSNEVTAVQLELQYDPKAIANIVIKPAKFFTNAVELMKRIDTVNGRITYMIGISPTQNPVSGSGTVAQITFSKVRGTKLESTRINFAKTENSDSIVAATGIDQSVLKQTTGTEILLNQ